MNCSWKIKNVNVFRVRTEHGERFSSLIKDISGEEILRFSFGECAHDHVSLNACDCCSYFGNMDLHMVDMLRTAESRDGKHGVHGSYHWAVEPTVEPPCVLCVLWYNQFLLLVVYSIMWIWKCLSLSSDLYNSAIYVNCFWEIYLFRDKMI